LSGPFSFSFPKCSSDQVLLFAEFTALAASHALEWR